MREFVKAAMFLNQGANSVLSMELVYNAKQGTFWMAATAIYVKTDLFHVTSVTILTVQAVKKAIMFLA